MSQKHPYYRFLGFFCLLFLLSCRLERPENQTGGLLEERQNRKIRRVTEVQLSSAAFERGQSLVIELNQTLEEQSKDLKTINCKDLVFNELPKEMDYISSYRLVCDSAGQMLEKEKQIWAAYLQNHSQNLPLDENLQKIDEQTLLFTAPFYHKGSFVGMWSVKLNKKELIKSL